MDIAELLAFSVKNKASDLHLSAGLPPMIRVDGDVRRINIPGLDHKQVHALVYDIMSDKQRRDYEEFLEVDFSFEIPGLARFRVNAFNHNRGAGAVFRTIPSEVLTLDQLGCPPIFRELINQPQGLILVTGPTGSGKSTIARALREELIIRGRSVTLLDGDIDAAEADLDRALDESMDASDPPASTQPVHRNDPAPSSGYDAAAEAERQQDA